MFILGIITTIVTTVVGTLLSGFVLTKLWIWFVVPTFHLPVLSIPTAIGLSLVARFMTAKPDMNVSDLPWLLFIIMCLIQTISTPLVALVFGAIVKNYM